MCDMDSKLCGEKATGYCSSSDDEEEGLRVEEPTADNVNCCLPSAPQTGPKVTNYKIPCFFHFPALYSHKVNSFDGPL